eukprot:865535-Pyramimonas_sp.AAC.1
MAEGEREYTRSGHQWRKGREYTRSAHQSRKGGENIPGRSRKWPRRRGWRRAPRCSRPRPQSPAGRAKWRGTPAPSEPTPHPPLASQADDRHLEVGV